MKYIIMIFVCCGIIGTGYGKISLQHKKTAIIDESLRLISFIRAELNYRKTDCEAIYDKAISSGFLCVDFENGRIVPKDDFPDKVKEELNAFFLSLGTSDAESQVLLCDEYYERVKLLSDEQRSVEKSKIQVDFAVCLLGVFSVIVLFL